MDTVTTFNQVIVKDRDVAVEQLNKFLRGEISAVETYKIALEKMKSYVSLQKLEQCLLSHEERVSKLRRRINELGGVPAEGSGAWGAWAKLVEGGAALFGESAAISALEEGEDHGLKEYREAKELDPTVQYFLNAELIPAQMQTHASLSQLKRSTH